MNKFSWCVCGLLLEEYRVGVSLNYSSTQLFKADRTSVYIQLESERRK